MIFKNKKKFKKKIIFLRVLEIKDIHLTGVSCLFIAIKFEETNTLKLSLVTSKIAHSKLTKKQILDKEFEILEKLEFELDSPTLLNFLELILKKINLKESLEEKIYNLFVKLVMYNAVMVVHEYTLLAKWKYSLLAAGITLVAFKLLQKIQSSFNIGIYVNFTINLKNFININFI